MLVFNLAMMLSHPAGTELCAVVNTSGAKVSENLSAETVWIASSHVFSGLFEIRIPPMFAVGKLC